MNATTTTQPLTFTGEFLVPGASGAWSEALHRARYQFACQDVAGKDVLDIACGIGYGAAALAAAEARSVDGVDIRPENVAHARQSYRAPNLRFLPGDITSFGETASYDVIVCFETIEHLSSPHTALRNCLRLLRPGGVLWISSPNRVLSSPGRHRITDKPENRFHVREFTDSELLLLLEAAGFEVDADGIFGQAYQLAPPGVLLPKAIRKCLVRPFGATVVVPDRNTLFRPNFFVLRARTASSACPDVP
jgi:SAM-dependent methyltransferase